MQSNTSDFDWDSFESGCLSKRNTNKSKRNIDGLTSYVNFEEGDANYEKLAESEVTIKDFNDGDAVAVKNIVSDGKHNLVFELFNGFTFTYDMRNERKFCALYNIDPDDCEYLTSEQLTNLLQCNLFVSLSAKGNDAAGSLLRGHETKYKTEFLDQIKNPTSAYSAKVIERNRGGFIVTVLGVSAFMPGSLAAANKIADFDSYIGRDVTVMVEDYLPASDMFIMSNKKYIKHVLPVMTQNLDTDIQYTGYITGTTNHSIFIEFGDMPFTGLLHISKMTQETKIAFSNKEFGPGDTISFWIKSIDDKNRIILSEQDPIERLETINKFKTDYLGEKKLGKVVSIKPFGVLVKVDKDIIGLIPASELARKNITPERGDEIIVNVDDVQEDKIYLSITNEK